MAFFSVYESSLVGRLTLTSDGEGLAGCWFERGRFAGGGAAAGLVQKDDLPAFDAARRWLDRYFAGEKPVPDELDLRPVGSEFRQLVWSELRRIGYGQTTTYGEVARRIEARTGRRACAQAVGGAVGHNPLGIIVPCHRVVGTNGALTGFAGGLDAKVALLGLEGVEVEAAGQKPTRVSRVHKG